MYLAVEMDPKARAVVTDVAAQHDRVTLVHLPDSGRVEDLLKQGDGAEVYRLLWGKAGGLPIDLCVSGFPCKVRPAEAACRSNTPWGPHGHGEQQWWHPNDDLNAAADGA